MRITKLTMDSTVTRYVVEGQLTQRTVAELDDARVANLYDNHTVVLDLTEVRFIDQVGVHALRDLRQHGAVLTGCSAFLSEMLASDEHSQREVQTEEQERDLQLLAALRRGEAAAFETLVRQYGGRLLATARRVLGNEHDAQDAVQEAYLCAFKAIGSFGSQAKLSTWLHRIVVNAALMKLRSRRRKPETSIDDLLPRFAADGEWQQSVHQWDISTEMLLQRQETREQVRHCIDQLPETYRTILVLRDIEELDTDETAAALSITANAVKIRLHRARQALRTLLERHVLRSAGEMRAHDNQPAPRDTLCEVSFQEKPGRRSVGGRRTPPSSIRTF